jgi:diguanylate cyclase (GGDEF)-like protein
LRILVADDDSTSRRVAQATVRSLGHECETVSDGIEAWDAFRSSPPDVVLSDLMMPGLNGLELCRKIRAAPSGASTYLVLVTSRGALTQILEGMEAGADDYLLKPLDPDALQARLIAAARVTSLHRQLAQQRTDLEGTNDSLTVIARRDALTGLRNRRALEEDLTLLEARVARYKHRYCMALLDVDHFKAYNDTYGHPAGDHVLQAVTEQFEAQIRGGDALYRYGGEEFLCIFPEQTLMSGTVAVERMRVGVQRLALPHTGSVRGVVTVSAGMAILDSLRRHSAGDVLQEADEALYRAKARGRNRVEQPLPLATAVLPA